MNDHVAPDDHLKAVLERAADGFEPDPDLRSRVDRRVGRQRRSAQLGLAMGLLVLVVVATSVVAIGRRTANELDVGSTGSGATATTAPAPETGAATIDWSTPTVSFRAESVLIDVAGMQFTGIDEHATLNSDGGIPRQYTTLERVWHENGVEMRVNIYFKGDGVEWWSDEIRTYDGAPGRGANWITYTGDFFRRPLGEAFTGDLVLPDHAASSDGDGRFVVRGLELLAFAPPDGCTPGSGRFVLDVTYPDVVIDGSGYGVSSVLYDSSCDPVRDLTAFRFVHTPADAGVVTAVDPCPPGPAPIDGCQAHATLLPVADGETTVQIDVYEIGGGLVASGSMHVTVARSEDPMETPSSSVGIDEGAGAP